MKHLRLALVLAAPVALCALARAQEEAQQRPPTEIPDFSNIDEFIYEPKSILSIGMRRISGAKTTFGGQGKLVAPEALTPETGALTTTRSYHDGFVAPDGRTLFADDGNGSNFSIPGSSDGRTNTWSYASDKQLTSDGYMSFHTYSAQITDTSIISKKGAATYGMELGVAYDMGKIGRSKASWAVFAGMSISDLNNSTSGRVKADVTTKTDYYDLFGQTPPTGPYNAPSNTSTSVDNGDGTTTGVTVDTSILLGNQPLGRTTVTTTNSTSVLNRWKIRGAYYTFRAGPTVSWPITAKLKVNLGAGAAFIYSGSTYSVFETFTPETGVDITDAGTDTITRGLPGYYVDANVEYDLTDRTGFYLGTTFQTTGSYDQTINTANANYSTKIDLTKQSGMSAGMTYRF